MNSKPLDNTQKKYIYKFDNKNNNNNNNNNNSQEYQPPSAVAVTKRIISSTVSALRKSKSKKKIDGFITNDNISKESESELELKKGKNGKEFPFNFLEENKNNNINSRKSISHVENVVNSKNSSSKGGKMGGYVGQIVEKGRKSTGVKVESNVGKAVELLQVKVLVTDMPAFMQIHAFQCARITFDSLEIFSAKHLASNLKKEFDKIYGAAWHCIVGSSFGSFVTHATGCFLYFSMEKLCILLFRTKVQRAVQQ